MPSGVVSCTNCGRTAGESGGVKLFSCTQCRTAVYCSKECQRKDWKAGGHKHVCKDLAARAAGREPVPVPVPVSLPEDTRTRHDADALTRIDDAEKAPSFEYIYASLLEDDLYDMDVATASDTGLVEKTEKSALHSPATAATKEKTGCALATSKSKMVKIPKKLAAAKLKAEKGDAEAAETLGLAYFTGKEVPQDYFEAERYFCSALSFGSSKLTTKQNLTESQFEIGRCYQRGGNGVPVDLSKAIEWYTKSAKKGHSSSKVNLATVLCAGPPMGLDDRNYVDGLKWYESAAEHKACRPELFFIIGDVYSGGAEGSPKDTSKSAFWFQKGAQAGDAQCMYRLSMDYFHGTAALAKDESKSAMWLKKSAGLNHSPALFFLSQLTAGGFDGNPPDIFGARGLFQRTIVAAHIEKRADIARDAEMLFKSLPPPYAHPPNQDIELHGLTGDKVHLNGYPGKVIGHQKDSGNYAISVTPPPGKIVVIFVPEKNLRTVTIMAPAAASIEDMATSVGPTANRIVDADRDGSTDDDWLNERPKSAAKSPTKKKNKAPKAKKLAPKLEDPDAAPSKTTGDTPVEQAVL